MTSKNIRRFLVFVLILTMSMGNLAFADNTEIRIEDYSLEDIGVDEIGIPGSKISKKLEAMDVADDEVVRVMVELKEKPVIDHATSIGVKVVDLDMAKRDEIVQDIAVQREETINQLIEESVEVRVFNTYENVFNGFAANVQYGDIKTIADNPNVKRVSVSNIYAMPEPMMVNSSKLTRSDITYANGYDGEGLIVSIIDSGIDWEHKDMRLDDGVDVGMTQAQSSTKIADFNLPGQWYSEKVPYGYNYIDHNDEIRDFHPVVHMHGMHVAGTVGANATDADLYAKTGIRGVAPNVQLLAMKVFSNDVEFGSTYGDILVDAMEDSIKLGADVMNLSIGAPAQWVDPLDPEQVAVRKATENGIIMSISAGNSAYFGNGEDLPFAENPDIGTVGSPGLAYESIQVASVDNYKSLYVYDITADGYSAKAYTASKWDEGAYPLTTIGGKVGNAEDFVGVDCEDKVVLVKRGAISFYDKNENAMNAGAAGIIVYNNDISRYFYKNQGDWFDETPFLMIQVSEGTVLENMLTSGDLTINIAGEIKYTDPNSGQISSFSSWGSTPSLDFKPEISAPGGNIYSTLNNDEYGLKSGTSMAAPHVAGGAAVVADRVAKHTELSALTGTEKALFIKNVMMNSATPIIDDVEEYTDGYIDEHSYTSVRAQGAGSMNLQLATETNVVIYEKDEHVAKVGLGEIDDIINFTLVAENFGNTEAIFDVEAMAQTNIEYMGYNLLDSARMRNYTVEIKAGEEVLVDETTDNNLVIPANSSVELEVTIDLTNATLYNGQSFDYAYPNGNYVEGFVFFNPVDEDFLTEKEALGLLVDQASDEFDQAVMLYNEAKAAEDAQANTIADLEAALADLESDKAALESDNADLLNVMSNLIDAENALNEAKAAYEQLVNDNPGVSAEAISVLETSIEDKQTVIDALTITIQGLTTEKETLASQLTDLQSEMNALQTTLNEKQTAVDQATSDVTNAQTAYDNVMAEPTSTQEQKDAALATLTAAQDALQVATDERNVAQDNVDEKQGLIDDKQSEIDDNQEALDEKNETLATKQSELETAQDDLANMEKVMAEINSASTAVDDAQAAFDNANGNVSDEQKNAYETYKAELAAIKGQIADKKIEISNAEDQLTKLESDTATKSGMKDDAAEALATAQANFDEAKTEYFESKPLSVPYLGFKGDFGDAPAFDKKTDQPRSFYNNTWLLFPRETDFAFLGNAYGVTDEDTIAISPNGDGVKDSAVPLFSMLRNLTDLEFRILDENMDVIKVIEKGFNLEKSFYDGGEGYKYHLYDFLEFDGTVDLKVPEDGQYYYQIVGKTDDIDKTEHELTFKMKIDTVAPVIDSIDYVNGGETLTVNATDEFSGISSYILFDLIEEEILADGPDATFDLSDLEDQPYAVGVYTQDYAGNLSQGEALIINDSTRPAVTFDISTRQTLTQSDYDVFVQVQDELTTEVYYQFDEGEEVEAELLFDLFGYRFFEAPLRNMTDDQHRFSVRVVDYVGNETEFSRVFYVDTEKPTIAITSDDFVTDETMEYVEHTVDSVTFSAEVHEPTYPTLNVYFNGNLEYSNSPSWKSYIEFKEPVTYNMENKSMDLEYGENVIQLRAVDGAGQESVFEKVIYRLQEGEEIPVALDLDGELVDPDVKVASTRPVEFNFEANKSVNWTIEIVNPEGVVVDTQSTTNSETATGTYAPADTMKLGGTYKVKASANDGEGTESIELPFTVYNYPMEIGTVSHAVESGMLNISVPVANLETEAKEGVVVVQVKDAQGTVISIQALTSNIHKDETATIKAGIQVPENGDYTANVFVWDKWTDPSSLSSSTDYDFNLNQ